MRMGLLDYPLELSPTLPGGRRPFDVRVLDEVGHERLELPTSGIQRVLPNYLAMVFRWVKGVVGEAR